MELAIKRQEAHRERGMQEGDILEFVSKPIPDDWAKWPVDRRCDFWAGGIKAEDASIHLVERNTICAAEIWRELYGHKLDEKAKKSESREINMILASIPGWKNAGVIRIPQYGSQRGFTRE